MPVRNPNSNWADVSGVDWVNLVNLLQNQNRPASSAATSDAALCENEFIHSLSLSYFSPQFSMVQ